MVFLHQFEIYTVTIDFQDQDTNVEMSIGVPPVQYPQPGKLLLIVICLFCMHVAMCICTVNIYRQYIATFI